MSDATTSSASEIGREIAAPRQQRLLSVYVAANLLLDRNRLWSSKEFAAQPSDITASTRRPSSGSR